MRNSLSDINYYEALLKQKETGCNSELFQEIDFAKLCRTCLREAPDEGNLFKEYEIGAMNISVDGKVLRFIDMLSELSALQINESDLMPQQICDNCIQSLSGAYFFRLQTRKADATLSKLLNALTEELEEKFENVQHLEEEFSDKDNDEEIEQQEIVVDNHDDMQFMEIEFDDVESQTNDDETEIDMLTVYNDDCEESVDSSSPAEVTKKLHKGNEPITLPVKISSPNAKKTKCPVCNDWFILKKDFEEHLRIAHPTTKIYKCDVCSTEFSHKQTLRRHMKIHESNQKNKVCSYCGKSFFRADDLKRHIRTHTNERPYQCQYCPKRYKQTSELKEHMTTHSRDTIYHCATCGKYLLTRNGYYVHMKVHAGLKNHRCVACSKSFVTAGELQSHIKHIHDKSKRFECNFDGCARKFVTKVALNAHQRNHTGDKPFMCMFCKKKFASSNTLGVHEKLHYAKKKLKRNCDLCQISFKSVASLKKHMRKMHKVQESVPAFDEVDEEENLPNEDDPSVQIVYSVHVDSPEMNENANQTDQGDCFYITEFDVAGEEQLADYGADNVVSSDIIEQA